MIFGSLVVEIFTFVGTSTLALILVIKSDKKQMWPPSLGICAYRIPTLSIKYDTYIKTISSGGVPMSKFNFVMYRDSFYEKSYFYDFFSNISSPCFECSVITNDAIFI